MFASKMCRSVRRKQFSSRGDRRRCGEVRRVYQTRLHFEPLEDRRLLSVFAVSNLSDDVATANSLRWAVAQANANADTDTIQIDSSQSGGTIDLIDFVSKLDATGLVIVRSGERSARVFDRDGAWANISCYTVDLTDYCSYERSGGDPLGYGSEKELAKLTDGLPHSTYAWRIAAAATPYPDAVVELSQIFQDGRAGDFFVVTRDHYGFRKVKAGNHGGAGEEDMRIPLLIAGPTVPHGEFGAARPVDIYPLMLGWYGIPVPNANYDGMDPFSKFAGDDQGKQRLATLDQLFEKKSDHKDILRLTRGADRKTLARQADAELTRRSVLCERLTELLGKLEAQRTNNDALKVADPKYLDDHISIVERTLAWAQAGSERMKAVAAALSTK